MDTIYIYASGNDSLGMGHLRRSINLANILRNKNAKQNIFFFGDYSEFAKDFLSKYHFQFFSISLLEFINKADSYQGIFVIIDSYQLTDLLYKKLNQNNVRWGAIDDFNQFNFEGAKFVINFRIGVKPVYKSNLSLIGPTFMPLDTELDQAKQYRNNSPKSNKVLICIGSSDIYNIGTKIAKKLATRFSQFEWILISNEQIADVKQKNLTVLPKTNTIYQIMKDIKFLISGGGGIKYESCYLSIPTLVYSQSEGELSDTKILESFNMIINGDKASNYTDDLTISHFENLIKSETSLEESCKSIFIENNNQNLYQKLYPLI
ncbi:hypothetical protein [Leptospira levettii]|uniref:UDP-2,4-diacetamido-2,4, 6-trideoxy-beta-L-altropyranose hydrolase n=1 Tax=Leptospira levettii TaxID=2023178 RepID=A0AAW5VDF8_9LEPT|nr:hypothetical protein [Leptospira levettii]MCW7466188.1 hypothetical protein [Leptospira levettii]MCW7512287.1 hypothetical protein [Leptospira levettii]MCW7516295.1 hypothetical protein [Leptospira levettii]